MFAVVYSSHNIHVELIIVLFSVVYVSPVVDTQVGRQVQIHRLAVYESLKEYLKGELSVAYFNAFFDFNICCVFSGVCQLYSEQRAMRMKRIVDRKRMYAVLALSSPSLSLSLSLSSPPPPSSLPFHSSLLSSCLQFFLSFFLSFRLQPEEHKKLLLLEEPPSLRKDSDKERSRSTTPSIHIEDSTDDSRENEDKQTEREVSTATTSDSVLPKPHRVEATVKGSDSANSLGVLANSDSGEGGGGVLDDGLTEEERETVKFNYACAVLYDSR